ncbi:MAG: hypothetical protein M1827_002069 [Pycnora praestabilis]|nr:MAG: hypothetical protein M1827_002069 [Pycnora praestabilis]
MAVFTNEEQQQKTGSSIFEVFRTERTSSSLTNAIEERHAIDRGVMVAHHAKESGHSSVTAFSQLGNVWSADVLAPRLSGYSVPLMCSTWPMSGTNPCSTPDRSPTWRVFGEEFFYVQYGGGEDTVYGSLGTDVISIGDLAMPNTTIGLARLLGTDGLPWSTHGILGLGFQSSNSNYSYVDIKHATFMESAQQCLDKPVVTANLRNKKAGYIKFGVIDQKAYKAISRKPPPRTRLVTG